MVSRKNVQGFEKDVDHICSTKVKITVFSAPSYFECHDTCAVPNVEWKRHILRRIVEVRALINMFLHGVYNFSDVLLCPLGF